LKTTTLSPFKWLIIFASTQAPLIVGDPTLISFPSSMSKTFSKETFEPSFSSKRWTKIFWSLATLNLIFQRLRTL
jgi:hypothetical protein